MSVHTDQTWFNVTTWADRDWKAAQNVFWHDYAKFRGWENPAAMKQAHLSIERAREDYRRRVLSWYRKLCLPMQVGDAAPDEVALLLAEEWDLLTRHRDEEG